MKTTNRIEHDGLTETDCVETGERCDAMLPDGRKVIVLDMRDRGDAREAFRKVWG